MNNKILLNIYYYILFNNNSIYLYLLNSFMLNKVKK